MNSFALHKKVTPTAETRWQPLCRLHDLVTNSGVVARADDAQVALFYLPESPDGQWLYAVDNRDPQSGANVIGRGIIGHLGGAPVIASPLYKQHFRLADGVCLEDPALRLRVWMARLNGDVIEIGALLPTPDSHPINP